ncbi:hypothetical protein EYF80_008110 [Liparis tanakae]|uniref:Uncharacterized protein n=1 Tax=Liparis tanakae TaxID=230148 RepID=A0A4Z2IVT7_9TELE|nr:hypothetical protein EYF80_008110 [Liparis tanakae]
MIREEKRRSANHLPSTGQRCGPRRRRDDFRGVNRCGRDPCPPSVVSFSSNLASLKICASRLGLNIREVLRISRALLSLSLSEPLDKCRQTPATLRPLKDTYVVIRQRGGGLFQEMYHRRAPQEDADSAESYAPMNKLKAMT